MPKICFHTATMFLLILFLFPTNGLCSSEQQQVDVDYSQKKNWSVLSEKISHAVDVFFVHPTTYGPPADGKYTASLDDTALNTKTDAETVNWITAAFSASCNVFAPRYRQVNIEVMKMKAKEKSQYFALPIKDITAAFTYYLKHFNEGRPFILASHSQGSNVLQLMLLHHPELLDTRKLVAAYMPGWTFTDADLIGMGLRLGQHPEETGVLLTWNTVGPGGVSPTVLAGARCVNPLSWTTDKKTYPASMDIAAKIFRENQPPLVIKHFTAARINDTGALEIPTPRPEVLAQLRMSLGKECYHRYDYDFFFDNVMENVKLRCETYLKAHAPKAP